MISHAANEAAQNDHRSFGQYFREQWRDHLPGFLIRHEDIVSRSFFEIARTIPAAALVGLSYLAKQPVEGIVFDTAIAASYYNGVSWTAVNLFKPPLETVVEESYALPNLTPLRENLL